MCDVNVYVYREGKEELYFENVDVLRREQGKVYLKNLFGEQKVFDGEIKEIALLKHRVLLEEKK